MMRKGKVTTLLCLVLGFASALQAQEEKIKDQRDNLPNSYYHYSESSEDLTAGKHSYLGEPVTFSTSGKPNIVFLPGTNGQLLMTNNRYDRVKDLRSFNRKE